MAINGKDNPSFRNEKNGWVKHFAFNWFGGGYNDHNHNYNYNHNHVD